MYITNYISNKICNLICNHEKCVGFPGHCGRALCSS